MFPTLSDLFAYLFNIHVRLPIQTFGFFVALSFLLTYLAFVSEFKRKEALGLIHAFKRKEVVGIPPSIPEILINTLLGFALGYKVLGALLNYNDFIFDPKSYLFSAKGSLLFGLLLGIGWGTWAYLDRKKAQLPQPEIVEQTIHPYQLMGRITFWCGVIGFIGAKLFDTVEHLDYFLAHPVDDLLSTNGFTYYGGFLFGMLTFFYIGTKNGMKLPHVSDVGAPGIMLAYGVGRIGCQLSGDGDWGIVNDHLKPSSLHWLPDWMWAYNFPHNIINQGVYIPGCAGEHCQVLVSKVYPTSFYESVICIAMFTFLWAIRKHIHKAALMSYLYLILIGIERFFIEFIRVTIRYNVFGAMLSQAQILSAGMLLVGISGVIYLYYIKKPAEPIPVPVS
jgi:phosphatidylglycerol:prolipoprotein diacylglycerol transferase